MKIILNGLLSLFVFLCSSYVYSDCHFISDSYPTIRNENGHKRVFVDKCNTTEYIQNKYLPKYKYDYYKELNKIKDNKIISKYPLDYIIDNIKINQLKINKDFKQIFQEGFLKDNINYYNKFSILDLYIKNNENNNKK